MRFNRYGRFEFTDTIRKRAAFARKQKKEREAFPLFADQIAKNQLDVDDEMEARAVNWARHEKESRQNRANDWRRARARLNAYPANQRRELFSYWQRCPYPADPSYLLTMLHSFDNGRLDMNPPTVRMTEENRLAVSKTIARILAEKAGTKYDTKPYPPVLDLVFNSEDPVKLSHD